MRFQRIVLAAAFGAAALCSASGAFAATRIMACGTIKEPGSYLLGKNLTAAGSCLVVVADNVTIDLDGQTIQGNGTGSGIVALDNGNVAVRNGSITGFVNGLNLDSSLLGSSVTDLRVSFNTGSGIHCLYACTITGNVLSTNGVAIDTSSGAVISGNTIYGDGPDTAGISASDTALVTGNNILNVDGTGIEAGYQATVTGNNVAGADKGIDTQGQSTVSENTVNSSGLGIDALGGDSTVQGNTAIGSTGIHVVCKSNVFDNTASSFSFDTGAGFCQQSNNLDLNP